jgi:CheY-like chemotaxis protein
MPCTKESLLIVDDAPAIRRALSQVFAESGYAARTAEDGYAALDEIRRQVPEFLISDLNMPGMSGFELLRVVRREFPLIRVIAMSGAFSVDEVPPGVAADAFYQKGRGIAELLKIMKFLPQPERWAQQSSPAPSPVWIARYQRNAAGEGYATIECPECMGTFPKVLNGAIHPINEADCLFCGSPVRYAILQPDDSLHSLPFQHERFAATPRNAENRKSSLEAPAQSASEQGA